MPSTFIRKDTTLSMTMNYEHLAKVHYRVESQLREAVTALLPASAQIKAVRAKGDPTTKSGGTIAVFVYCPTLDDEGFNIMIRGLKHRFECYAGVFHYTHGRKFALHFRRAAIEQRFLCTKKGDPTQPSAAEIFESTIEGEGINPEQHNTPGKWA